MDQHKKKPLRFTAGINTRPLRALNRNEERSNLKHARMSLRRNIDPGSNVVESFCEETDGNSETNAVSSSRPEVSNGAVGSDKTLSRFEMLKKWKEEKELKKKLEALNKPPPFRVPHVSYKPAASSLPSSFIPSLNKTSMSKAVLSSGAKPKSVPSRILPSKVPTQKKFIPLQNVPTYKHFMPKAAKNVMPPPKTLPKVVKPLAKPVTKKVIPQIRPAMVTTRQQRNLPSNSSVGVPKGPKQGMKSSASGIPKPFLRGRKPAPKVTTESNTSVLNRTFEILPDVEEEESFSTPIPQTPSICDKVMHLLNETRIGNAKESVSSIFQNMEIGVNNTSGGVDFNGALNGLDASLPTNGFESSVNSSSTITNDLVSAAVEVNEVDKDREEKPLQKSTRQKGRWSKLLATPRRSSRLAPLPELKLLETDDRNSCGNIEENKAGPSCSTPEGSPTEFEKIPEKLLKANSPKVGSSSDSKTPSQSFKILQRHAQARKGQVKTPEEKPMTRQQRKISLLGSPLTASSGVRKSIKGDLITFTP